MLYILKFIILFGNRNLFEDGLDVFLLLGSVFFIGLLSLFL